MFKKLLCVCIALTLALTATASVAALGVGDVDRDGKRTAGDARLTLRAAVGLENFDPDSVEFIAADTNGDGKLTAEDARSALRAAVALDTLPEILPSPKNDLDFSAADSTGDGYAREDDNKVYDAALSRYVKLTEQANAELDPGRRYTLFAEAEAYLLDSAVVQPTTTSGGNKTVSRVAPKTAALCHWGCDGSRVASLVVTRDLISSADREALTEQWEKARVGEGAYDPAKYLVDRGYGLATTYSVGMTKAPDTLDWLGSARSSNSDVLVNLVDGLVRYDNFGRIVPALAESWEVSEDGLTYTFHLRKDVKWVTADGRFYTNLTANDFVAGFRHMLDVQGGLERLTAGIVAGVESYLSGRITDFAGVGVKAADDYTVVYTLERPAPYFLTMFSYNIFLPICDSFYKAKGGAYGLESLNEAIDTGRYAYGFADDLQSQVYCGAYLPVELDENGVTLRQNPDYYDRASVRVTKVQYVQTAFLSPEEIWAMLKDGRLSDATITQMLQEFLDKDEIVKNCVYIGETSSVTYMNALTLNRGTFALENGAGASNKSEVAKLSYAAAVSNKNFRKALVFAFDKTSFNAVTVGGDVAANNLRNMLCDPNLFFLSEDTTDVHGYTFPAGTSYGELVAHYCERMNLDIDVRDGVNGWYNPENAKTYLEAAKAELGTAVAWPVQLDVVYYTGNQSNTNQAAQYKKIIEGVLGKENVVVNLIGLDDPSDYYDCFYRIGSGAEKNCDVCWGSGWGADYGDPYTYLGIFMPTGYMTSLLGVF